ncbi:hypothetical protein LCGC14_1049840 [marine sediment metagenome]|uniref:Uncharacterized protein n=1 Tax=marine sediment metagenome TaxID=412755 RepID=A0A0F9MP86_9ZZZZ
MYKHYKVSGGQDDETDNQSKQEIRTMVLPNPYYIHTKGKGLRALRKRDRMIARGFIVMWVGEHLICMMKATH